MASTSTKHIKEALFQFFHDDGHRIVFWNDPEGEFTDTLKELDLGDVKLIRLDEYAPLEIKILLELQDKTGAYLLYDPNPEPAPEDDWLLDIRLYSRTFYADAASIILNELGLEKASLRLFMGKRKKFFRSRNRLEKLKKWVMPGDQEKELDLKMMAVVARAEQPDHYQVLMSLFSAYCSEGAYSPGEYPKIWEDFKKLELERPFWQMIAENFGYVEENPSLHDLILRLFVTDFANDLNVQVPLGLEHFLITENRFALNVSVFLSQWRNNRRFSIYYSLVAEYVEKELDLNQHLSSIDPEALLDVMTFEAVEKRIIVAIKDRLTGGRAEDFQGIEEIIKKRRDGHWVNANLPGEGDNLYRLTYSALESALHLFELRGKFDQGLGFKSAKDMFKAYTDELFQFDFYYRLFHENAGKVELGGWDVLKALSSSVESCYSGWYLDRLCLTWDGFFHSEGGQGLLATWKIPGVTGQADFFKDFIQGAFSKRGLSRVVVVISDGLRFESAHELLGKIGGNYGFGAELSAMLGVLPSYTALGMAALLPHTTIRFSEGSPGDQLLVDERPCASVEQRSQILAGKKGVAIKADDLLAMNKQEGREFIKPFKVIYVYHNTIDATGDKAASESKTFDAVRSAIGELARISRFLINNLNISLVFITSDHGFIYQDTPPKYLDKSGLESKPKGTVLAKKRFILGRGLGNSEKVWHGTTRITAGTEDNMEFWLPKGINRFHFVGGARYFHGGAALQEVVIPVVTVQKLRGKEREKSQVKRVGVSLIGFPGKIVMNRHRFEFIQTDPVTNRVMPRTLLVSLRDGNELISNEETVTFDSASQSMDKRKRSIKLVLKQGEYDNKKQYFLVLRDAETKVEYERIPVTIDLAFASEF